MTEQHRADAMRMALVKLSDVFRDVEDPADISFAAAKILGETLDVSRAGYGIIDPDLETITIERDWNAPGIASLAGVLQFRDYGSYIEDLKRGKDVIIADARLDARTRAGADALKAISAEAVINMPLTEHGGLVALLYLNHATARDWPDDELTFIREVAERTRAATERRRAEIELAALAASLEAQVEQRTVELLAAEEALRQSQKMEAVGQLTGGLAHDFNNLLTGIAGSLEMLQMRLAQGRASDVDRYVNAAQGAARRAASLTHRLLAFSRRQTLAPKATNVKDLINGMVELIARTVGPGIKVETVNTVGCGFRMWTAPYLQEHFGSIDLIACIRMSGLLMRSHMNAGQDGFRYACSKRRCDLLMAIGIHGLSHISDRSIPHTTCLFPASSGISPAR